MKTRIKICGITRVEDALLAAKLGCDAIGLVFFAKSPRCLSIVQAQKIVTALPPFITTVGLFVDETAKQINAVLQQVNIDLLQFHGHETEEECGLYHKPYIKVIRMRETTDLQHEISRFPRAQAILLDTFHAQQPGGTGIKFDWQLVPKSLAKVIILAGGLNPDNVADAISLVRPYAVDVSSGVEMAPGIKDPEKLAAFIAEVRGVNNKLL